MNRGEEIHEAIVALARRQQAEAARQAVLVARRALRPRLRWIVKYPRLLDVYWRLWPRRRPAVGYRINMEEPRIDVTFTIENVPVTL